MFTKSFIANTRKEIKAKNAKIEAYQSAIEKLANELDVLMAIPLPPLDEDTKKDSEND